MNRNRIGEVFVRGMLAGEIEESDEGYEFRYLPEYLQGEQKGAVSLTLPVREEPYIAKTLFPFFDGLIPEGWLLRIVARNWKIDQRDRFGILLVACKDPIGNVTVKEKK